MTPTRGLGLAAACALALVIAAPTVSFAMDATSPPIRTHSPLVHRSHERHDGGHRHRHVSLASHKSPGRNKY
jgi:hypothetical protein